MGLSRVLGLIRVLYLTRAVGSLKQWGKGKLKTNLFKKAKGTTITEEERSQEQCPEGGRQLVPAGYNPSPVEHQSPPFIAVQNDNVSTPTPPAPTPRPLTPMPQDLEPLQDFNIPRLRRRTLYLGNKIACVVCIEIQDASQFPERPHHHCPYKSSVCRSCLAKSITCAMKSSFWLNMRCIFCSAQMEYKDIAAYASKEDFAKYDNFILQNALKDIPNYLKCLSPTCSFGQIYPSTSEDQETMEPLINCSLCGFASCSYHGVPWHVGETCEEYDAKRGNTKAEKKSEAKIGKSTKPCPNKECGRLITKAGGCNGIVCICGCAFCWRCGVAYDDPDQQHGERCGEHNVVL
ncbi:hypothetical protein HYALB_00011396 [Hymenoscyphus albidus]|uniref:RBR-type E3 ubiquitin transferase n=1 Tax=Hymenoscyphus albidus TaxID=595503 RepID=A0A9N9LH73_9HELO|nr:hypothetical protein HYALB_00011396 [Hymenoscyphus albidus]